MFPARIDFRVSTTKWRTRQHRLIEIKARPYRLITVTAPLQFLRLRSLRITL